MNELELSWGACTDRGLRRIANEDAFIADSPVFVVADGMGGHEAGAEASNRAIQCFEPLLGRPTVTTAQLETALRSAISSVLEISRTGALAGTTLTGAVLTREGDVSYWLVFNVGDSRVYRVADGMLAQISVDHSAVQALIDDGRITVEDAAHHPQRNVVTRAIGAGSRGDPDYWLLPVRAGDRLLICSDGLTKELTDERIADALAMETAAQAAATRLVHEALLHGGRDNVTAVVVDAHRVQVTDDEPTHPASPGGEGSVVDDDTRPRPQKEDARNAHL